MSRLLIVVELAPGVPEGIDGGSLDDCQCASDGFGEVLNEDEGNDVSGRDEGEVDSLAMTSRVQYRHFIGGRQLTDGLRFHNIPKVSRKVYS